MWVGAGCCVAVEVGKMYCKRWDEMRRCGTEAREEQRELAVPSEDDVLHFLLLGDRHGSNANASVPLGQGYRFS